MRFSERLKQIKCFFGYHDWYCITRLGVASMHVGCRRCTRQWGMNHDARALLPWGDVADFHAEVHNYHPRSAA